jgi:hypothetical protein
LHVQDLLVNNINIKTQPNPTQPRLVPQVQATELRVREVKGKLVKASLHTVGTGPMIIDIISLKVALLND